MIATLVFIVIHVSMLPIMTIVIPKILTNENSDIECVLRLRDNSSVMELQSSGSS